MVTNQLATKKNLYIVSYVVTFFFALFYVVLNPEAGRDYYSYINIIKSVDEAVPLKEFGFYYTIKVLSLLHFSPESIMLILRTIMFLLLLRFFYFASKQYKLLGLIFFLFVPNIFIGSLNALQTWLAISIFLQAFIKIDKIEDKKVLLFSVIAFLFHAFSILYIVLYVSYKYFNRYIKVLIFLTLLIGFKFLEMYISDFIGFFGYLRYLDFEAASTKFIALSLVFMLVFLFSVIANSNKKIQNIYLDLFFALLIFVLLVKTIGVGNELALRSLNFFLPFIWLSFIIILNRFNPESSFLLSVILGILIIINFFVTVDFNSDMLNLEGFRRIV